MHAFALIVAAVPALLALAGIAFSLLALVAAWSFLRDSRATAATPVTWDPPSISILKAVKGLDPGLLEALHTYCTQLYPAPVELLLAVQSPDDPALPVLRQLAQQHPGMRIQVIHTPLVLGTNGKCSNLAQLLPHARHTLLLISDADIAVRPGYFQRITAPFAHANMGLVTVPYWGRTHPVQNPALGSRLEALGIATDFLPGVLTARLTEGGLHFGLGSTLLVSRPALAAAGGFEALVNVLADDHDLGHRIHQAGFRVILSPEPVSTSVPAYTFSGFWQHQLRWARTVRSLRPATYLGLALTHPVPWALLYLLSTAGSIPAWILLGFVLAARVTVALALGYRMLGDRQVLRDLPLLPLRDCLALALWAWSFASNIVEWRGERFRIEAGKLIRGDTTR